MTQSSDFFNNSNMLLCRGKFFWAFAFITEVKYRITCRMSRLITFFLLFTFYFFLLPLSAQVIHQMDFDRFSHYKIDDWITYAPATVITSVDIGEEYAYFGTLNGGILRYDLYENNWEYPYTTSSGLSSNRILRVVFDAASQRLYAQTSAGIDEYNRGFNYWQPSYSDELPPRRAPQDVEIADFQSRKNYRFPPYYRPALAELPDFFTDRDLLFRPPDEVLDTYNRIFKLNPERMVDKFRRLWLSSDGLGVGRADLNNFNLKFSAPSISNIFPRDLYFDSAAVWIGGVSSGSQPAGISLWNFEDDTWRYFEAGLISGFYNDNIYAITGNRQFIFFASDLGMVQYNKESGNWRTFTSAQRLNADKVNDLIFWSDRLFIATTRGFNWMEGSFNRIQESADRTLRNISVLKILAQDSTLLLSTNYGIYQYFPQRDQIQFMTTGSAILDVGITAINARNDSLWLAGQDGIMFFDPLKKEWRSFTYIAQQLNGKINDIAFTDQLIWFATESGLLKYDMKRDYWYLYTKKDGLADNRVYHIDVNADELWLSTRGGVTIFIWQREGRVE